MAPRVTRISIAPVKSLGLVHPDEIELEPHGVRGNRRFWLVDRRRAPVQQQAQRADGAHPARVGRGHAAARAHLPGRRARRGHRRARRGGRRRRCTAIRIRRGACSGRGRHAISEFVGLPLTLLWAEQHAVDRGYRGGTVSLVSRASLERLGEEARRRRAGRRPPLPDALRDRRGAGARRGRMARHAGARRRRRRSS